MTDKRDPVPEVVYEAAMRLLTEPWQSWDSASVELVAEFQGVDAVFLSLNECVAVIRQAVTYGVSRVCKG